MTFQEYWDALCKRNPPLSEDETKMTITAASFKRSMQQAYDQGQQHKKPEPASKSIFGGMGF